MKKLKMSLLLVACLVGLFQTAAFAAEGLMIDIKDTTKGLVHISFKNPKEKPAKVLITKGKERYTYQLNGEGRMETYPLQMGSGTYSIGVLELIKGNTYAFVENRQVEVKLSDPDRVFLASIQEVNWEPNSNVVYKSVQLVGKEKSDEKRFDLVYTFLVEHLTYDYAKVTTLKPSYLPDVSKTLNTEKGICYDYSALLAAMIRSQGIPTKLVKGYTKNTDVLHAWNEVKIDGHWWVIDTTFDSISFQKKVHFERVKEASDYRKISEY